jgi:NAD(P)-dependent dehydrogenase (short-subunit alcohol dehydrogenase family)
MSWTIQDKQVLVTGANSGIGKATAQELASRGARVMITARDSAKGRDAAAEINATTGAAVEVGILDLSSFGSVRAFAAKYSSSHDRLDVLINNAGVMAASRRETPDGNEWTFAVNHLGPFLLTSLLKETMLASAPARIINVSSENHRSIKGGLDFDDLQMEKGYSSSKAYAASKVASILFAVELNRRFGEKGITARALHPGVVATSFGKGPDSPRMMGVMMTVLKPFLRKPAKGAATSVFLATADDEAVTESLYWSDEAPAQPTLAAIDPEAAARLWLESDKLVRISE